MLQYGTVIKILVAFIKDYKLLKYKKEEGLYHRPAEF